MHANAILNLWYFIHTISKWVEKMVIPQASDYAGPRYRHIAQKALDDVLADLSSVPRPLWTRGPLQSSNKSVRTLADFTYD